ncbi:MAG: bifunctional glutamate N-acetyltransferase/amino-acid acetyltransferase ArgJ [Treponema sp.]|jgi:glutamate N-acetyltransferase/amino-acid N-acetyltransferase|nr:bifunctional glutamate N-acetyltransferase/amino-acid acetyltransferase ArgJ [Treponema sp.]
MKEISGGVCAPKGFRAGGVWCGIKASSTKKDLALIYSEKTCNCTAMYTTNRVKAASVLVSQINLAGGKCHGIIANSGNANACTGALGLQHAKAMAGFAAEQFVMSPSDFAVASTGVIGVPMPIARIEAAAESLANSLRGDAAGHEAALEAIMTTDTKKKDGAIEIELDGKSVRLGAMVKGSGMIHPNMATMLCFVTTDAAINKELLDKALRNAVAKSFNRVSVDGDTSTNDMILVMANGQAGNQSIESENADYAIFAEALESICVKLARAMAADGEGATKLLSVSVNGAASESDAETLAKSVVYSSLVKCAIFGADANWGRVLCAMGYAGINFDPETVDVCFASKAGKIAVCKAGASHPFDEEDAKKILSEDEIEIGIDMKGGEGNCTVWGCDLTYDYVKINGDYRS